MSFHHLTQEDRLTILSELSNGLSIKEIAAFIDKDPTTISKELKRHRTMHRTKNVNGLYKNSCVYASSCSRRSICSPKCSNPKLTKSCSFCHICNSQCPDYELSLCKRLKRAPHVCNGCSEFTLCRKPIKYKYDAIAAHKSYVATLKTSREGINLSLEQLTRLDDLITPRIQLGQPIAHIYEHHKEKIPCTIKSIYNYTDRGVFTIKNIDLARKVRYKVRSINKKLGAPSLNKKRNRENRTYKDYSDYINNNPTANVVQMDLVEGVKGGKLILTFLFVQTKLMLMYLVDDKKSETIFNVILDIRERLGEETFSRVFKVLVTDNGGEFQFPNEYEALAPGIRLFYCNAMASYQKGALEKNHEYIRYILPKGTPFDDLTQEKVTLVCNHINATFRPKMHLLETRSPFDLSEFLFGKELLSQLGLSYVHYDHVCLKPLLIK